MRLTYVGRTKLHQVIIRYTHYEGENTKTQGLICIYNSKLHLPVFYLNSKDMFNKDVIGF